MPSEDTPKKDSKNIAEQVKYLTGDFYEKIKCKKLQSPDREFYDEVVYLGDVENLEGEHGKLLTQLSLKDRFIFDQQHLGFYYNDDPECRKKYDLDETKNYLLMLNGVDAMASHVELVKVTESMPNDLMYTINR